MTSVSVQGSEATISTRETLEYAEYLLARPEERVPRTAYFIIQDWTYHLVRTDGRWLVDHTDTPVAVPGSYQQR